MKKFDKIWILIWNLPLLLFTGLTLSSNLCELNNWSAWFIAMALYFNRAYTDLKYDLLEHKIDKIKENFIKHL